MDFLKLVLATYLVAVTLARLHGPLGLAERLRHTVYRARGFRQGAEDTWMHPGQQRAGGGLLALDDDWVSAGINCPVCLAPYVALVLLAAPPAVLSWLAVAGGAAALFKAAHR